MNAFDLSRAIAILNTAGRALRKGDTPWQEQMRIGEECYRVAIRLESALNAINITLESEIGAPDVPCWLIWSNEHDAWWGPNHCGYPRDVANAGRYTHAQAIDICKSRTRMNRRPPETMLLDESAPAVPDLAVGAGLPPVHAAGADHGEAA